ncbi:MAG: hypothetical protein PVSMB7_26530 [Chloroflexota bacterium]
MDGLEVAVGLAVAVGECFDGALMVSFAYSLNSVATVIAVTVYVPTLA